jgi:hypothetical protein
VAASRLKAYGIMLEGDTAEGDSKEQDKLRKSIEIQQEYIKQLQIMQKEMQSQKKTNPFDFMKTGTDQIDAQVNAFKNYQKEVNEGNKWYARMEENRINLMKARGDDASAIYEQQLNAFDATTVAMISATNEADEIDRIFRERVMQRETLELNQKKDMSTKRLALMKEEAQARLDYAAASGIGDYGAAEREAYDIETAALLNAASARGASLETINKMYKTRELAYDKQVMQMRLGVVSQAAGQFASAFQMMYQMGGSHARKWFQLWKTAAIAESIVNTYKGATAALAVPPPPLGMALAAAITAAGMANVARIASTNFGSSTTGGAAGTYAVSSTSGTPEYKYFDYESSKYGTGWKPGESEAPAASQQMNITIQAMDSKSFEKYVRENPNAIKQTLKDIQGGYV